LFSDLWALLEPAKKRCPFHVVGVLQRGIKAISDALVPAFCKILRGLSMNRKYVVLTWQMLVSGFA